MSFEEDFIQYDALRPELFFFAPPPQHTDAPSCESFDQDVAELDLDLDLDFPFQQIDDFFRAFVPIIPSSPSTLTYSTDSVDEVTSSLYTPDLSQSDYSILSEIDSYYSLNNGLDGTHDSIHSAGFSSGPPSIPPFHPVEAQFDFGTPDLSPNVGISQEDLSSALQPPSTSVVPASLPFCATPDSEAQKAPTVTSDKPFKCPFCHHSSDRSYNMNTHIATHYKLKPFNCDDCGRGFTRRNDLDRHRQNPRIHRKQSAYPDSIM